MDHQVTTHTLEGGAKLLAIDVPNAISCYFRTSVRAGYRFCDPDVYEVPHLLEHLAFEGNRTYPEPLSFKVSIEGLGAGYNATTSVDSVSYWFTAGSDHLEQLAKIALTQVLEPLFLPERVEQQKEVIVNELSRSLDNDTRNRAYRNYNAIFPKVNPEFDRRIAIVKKIAAQDVTDFYQKTYGTRNLSFLVAGNFKGGQLTRVLKLLNDGLERHPRGKRFRFTPLKSAGYQRQIQAFPSNIPSQHHFFMRFGLPEYDLPSRAALQVLSVMYSSGLGSRMQMKAREAGLTYTFGSGADTDHDMTDFAFSDQVPPEKLLPLFDLATKELATFKAGDYTNEELERAIGFMAGGVKRGVQTPADLAGGYGSFFLYDEPLLSPQDWIAQIEAVGRIDIQTVCDKYLTPKNWILTLIGNGLEDKKADFQEVIDRHFG